MTLTRLPVLLVSALLLVLNTLLHAIPLIGLAVIQRMVPIEAFRAWCTRALMWLGGRWIDGNKLLIRHLGRADWRLTGDIDLDPQSWQLVLSNHQSWVDIPVLQWACNHRIPFLKFFLKNELIFVPVLGLAWWALDFPFMKRHARQFLEKHPHRKGEDLEATRRACAKFAKMPTSVMIFVEGTRFTPQKHARQRSPYRHLLKPRAGGVAQVLDVLGERLSTLLDVTIVYPDGRPGMLELLSGQVRRVLVEIRRVPIPAEFRRGGYDEDPAFRERFQTWLNQIWREKDQRIALLCAG
jgi:1-acyl-sn-glycerol-3-phosphate acyltransferase